MDEVEIAFVDARYENLRLKDKSREKALFDSIHRKGIQEPLQCVKKGPGNYLLLDGFKRWRSAKRMGISCVPVVSLGNDEAVCMLYLIRQSNNQGLHIVEQASFVDELHRTYLLSVTQIAKQVERSPAWVSVRLGILSEMGPVVKEAVFSNKFPLRSYMYTLRQFTRVNKAGRVEVDKFVGSVSGKGLSTRDIQTLAYGYFRGGTELARQIENGNLNWTLKKMRNCWPVEYQAQGPISELENKIIRDLELVQKYMDRVKYALNDPKIKSPGFFATADLLVAGLLQKLGPFKKKLEEFHDKRGHSKYNQNAV